MTVDGGWHWYLKRLPERVKGCHVEFNVIEREIGSHIPRRVWEWDKDNHTIATRVSSSDTLIGILFEESLKSKGISLIDEEEFKFLGHSEIGLCITIVLSQMADNTTNINAEVLDLLSKVLDSEWGQRHDA